MSITFRSALAPYSFDAANSHTFSLPVGVTAGDLLVFALAVEGQAAGSGPWIDTSGSVPGSGILGPGGSWKQACYQAPSASGAGLEVWVAIYGSGSIVKVNLLSSLNAVGLLAAWSGVYAPTNSINDGSVRGAVSAQVSGDDPAAPSVYAFVDELLIAVGADTLASPGFGTPTPAGWASRTDGARDSTYGNVEAVLADKAVTVEGDTGTIPFAATASPSGAKGATATLAVRPTPPAATSPLIAVEFAVAS